MNRTEGHSMTMFPEELLAIIAKNVAYSLTLIECEVLKLPIYISVRNLLPLSMTSRQFRRICLPLLFTHVKLGREGDLKRLRDQCIDHEDFISFIRALSIDTGIGQEDIGLIPHLLPLLSGLVQLLLNQIPIHTKLLSVIHSHSLNRVVIDSIKYLPKQTDESNSSGLSKIILRHCGFPYRGVDPTDITLESYLGGGMQITHLSLNRPHLMDEGPQMGIFHGLRELKLYLHSMPTDLSWLPNFSRAHPLLQKITFTKMRFVRALSIDAILPFLEAVGQEGLATNMQVKAVALSRELEFSAEGSHDWRVTGMFLQINGSLERILYLASSFFPRISRLTVENGCCTINELIVALGLFSSLVVVGLSSTFSHIDFGIHQPWEDFSKAVDTHCLPIEAPKILGPMIWYASMIADRVPSIQALYIKEHGYDGPPSSTGRWGIRGYIDLQRINDYSSSNPEMLAHCLKYINYFTGSYRSPDLFPGSLLYSV
ncbi:hypothetical protein C8R42DRAFT_776067 [Lentinula raphanica]|nr:hypothetical protein C8R42DRAFT_776067 [Lentinula raphanica]